MSEKYTLVHEGLDKWINSPNNGGECCQTCADTVDELNRLLNRINEMEEIIPILMRGIDRTLKGSADRYFAAYRKAEQLLKLNAHEDHNTNASHRASGAVHRYSV